MSPAAKRVRLPSAVPIGTALLRRWPLPDPAATEGKEDRGRVLVVGGSAEVPGAALLAGIAALRAGAGKLQIVTARPAAMALAIAVPEARVIGQPIGRGGEIARLQRAALEAAAGCDAALVGPGMAHNAGAARIAAQVIAHSRQPLVLDAGALAAHATCRQAASTVVLTPHHGEMARIMDVPIEDIAAEPARAAATLAARCGAIVVLKGAVTFIASPSREAWINREGSVALGTSGSGDVLAGVIAGLLARGAPAEQAAVWGVYLHARAGAALERRHGQVGSLAREIAAEIPALMASF